MMVRARPRYSMSSAAGCSRIPDVKHLGIAMDEIVHAVSSTTLKCGSWSLRRGGFIITETKNVGGGNGGAQGECAVL